MKMLRKAEEVRELVNAAFELETPCFFAVDFELENGLFLSGEDLKEGGDVRFRVGKFSNAAASKPLGRATRLRALPESFETYRVRFDKVMRAIIDGDSYLANLTIRTPIETDVSLEEIFGAAQSAFALYVKDSFACFSPERFVKIEGGKVSSFPMKGTAEAASAEALAALMADEKELAEHYTIVDLIRNDLNIFSENVRVERFRYAEKVARFGLPPIFQTSSEISADYPDCVPLGDYIWAMLPAGSVSGAPKRRTVEILRGVEGEPRGFYAGVFGFFDGKDFDSAVAIRFIEKRGDSYFYRSGGGITCNSSALYEYREAAAKIYLPFG